eukprot:CAMPEP_0202853296 /NCGR_PEP_ID=MMETSP1389-20130828/90412_1 /ASSEMBLY_ACC=CAM_ASM_000865 /TAXON_ID=302021 /ORGANISM="Rhodomonas sp., Strain CCMP768" /LENGTH=528 /DNA_ID=CAMNT_0049531845 /DNA_START=20 /DNA_END=1606 /DNA_ORIENTATION=-
MSDTKNTQVELSFTPEFEIVGPQPTKLTFSAHLAAPEVVDETDAKRSTVSLTAVIDKSGSMKGQKLELVKQTCNFMLNQLASNDKLGVVEYDSFVNELIPLSRATDDFKTEAATVINRMTSGSCTNLSGGLFEGIKQQQTNTFVDSSFKPPAAGEDPNEPQEATTTGKEDNPFEPRAVPNKVFQGREEGARQNVEDDALRSVFLFTDGLATEGITNTNELIQALGQKLDLSPRVRVYTFGFGADHSPELLAELARVGSGTYYFMEKEEAIPTAFADALGGLLSVAAQNVTVEFKPAEGVTVSNVHTAFTTTAGGGGARTVAVGDLFSAEGKDLLFEVELGGWEAGHVTGEGQVTVGTLVLSYLDVQGACLCKREVACTVTRAAALPAEGVPANEKVALQKARIETARSMAEARAAAERGDLSGARGVVRACLERVQGVQCAAGNLKFQQQLCSDLLEAESNMVDRERYHSRGAKMMWAKSKAHMEQRSACLSDDEDEGEEARDDARFSYANVKQKAMRGLAKKTVKSS